MKVVKSLKDAGEIPKLCIALGNFDGLHLGHQQLISGVVNEANKINGTSAVLTFFPHPAKVISPEKVTRYLINDERKLNLLKQYGIKLVIQLPFTQEFADIQAEAFIKELNEAIQLAHLVIGFNYTFGRGGAGDWRLLEKLSKEYKFSLQVIPPVIVNDILISSTAIRTALLEGNISVASQLLGRPPLIEGEVESGNKFGRKLGFPTANIKLVDNILLPKRGVYLARVVQDNCQYFGLLNIGLRPTLTNTLSPVAEVHILKFDNNIYGQWLEVYLLEKLRDEKKFANPDQLVNQIKIDISSAWEIIAQKY
ncbi:MAG: bifunctional riboflavin kinase/FAD synthetase [Clostridia bacterium]|jgi:riboflavin kinase/FMN adenylyltransferase|nr:bifunctional riboflavin kinase/FAD synthetase [Clostridia bacterium]